ncbi:RNA polymerase sigma-70 factor [uncultured Sunxiuqinia sp.]|uniref:RNA polymerase sigma-70 factor n=1 Tax=uncultured Sunxiuqinia sp. TaxID=1573825 RepID=UPI00262B3A07|nr:RNA polymerase sigma-70 factor [uncultured Sunxiuqinia sp.]
MKAENHSVPFFRTSVSALSKPTFQQSGGSGVLSVVRPLEDSAQETDKECVDRLVCEDRGAFRKLFEKYYKELYVFARQYVHSSETCKDILQDVFSYLWEKREQLEINQSVKAYLYRAVHHQCLNYLKKTNTTHRHLTSFHLQQQQSFLYQQNAHDQLQEKELQETIHQAMASLPEQCRKIFLLSREQGLKHKEIARQLSISPKTVEVQIYRALKYLKQQLPVSATRTKK